MPITKQAKKAASRDANRQVNNLRSKRLMKQTIKEVGELSTLGSIIDAEKKLSDAYKAIDKAAKKGIIKKNTAARKKSRIAKLFSR